MSKEPDVEIPESVENRSNQIEGSVISKSLVIDAYALQEEMRAHFHLERRF